MLHMVSSSLRADSPSQPDAFIVQTAGS